MVSEVAKDLVFEVVCTGPADLGPAVRAEVNAGTRGWAGLRGMKTIDVYSPVVDGAFDPFNDDGAGPLFIAIVAFGTRDALKAALETAPLAARMAEGAPRLAYTCTAFERHFYPVAGEAKPAPLRARFSYVVRYHKPAADEAAFIDNYVATHPPTLATLPGIRSVMCYFPEGLAAPGVAPADYIIGNEVAFDSVEDFNTAMQSPVRQELRRHFHEFPPFTGRNTHFPMNRARLVG